ESGPERVTHEVSLENGKIRGQYHRPIAPQLGQLHGKLRIRPFSACCANFGHSLACVDMMGETIRAKVWIPVINQANPARKKTWRARSNRNWLHWASRFP